MRGSSQYICPPHTSIRMHVCRYTPEKVVPVRSQATALAGAVVSVFIWMAEPPLLPVALLPVNVQLVMMTMAACKYMRIG